LPTKKEAFKSAYVGNNTTDAAVQNVTVKKNAACAWCLKMYIQIKK
jgi:hypothetical protein